MWFDEDFGSPIDHAIIWCWLHFDPTAPATSLRNRDHLPLAFEWFTSARVQRIVEARKTSLDALVDLQVIPDDYVKSGKLLVFFPEANLSDGLAEELTHGVLDRKNCLSGDRRQSGGLRHVARGWTPADPRGLEDGKKRPLYGRQITFASRLESLIGTGFEQ